jgi:hypothetical protein
MNKRFATVVLAILVAGFWPASAQDARQIVNEALNRARSKSEHYEGTLEVVNPKQKVSTKRWTFDRLGAYGNSKAVLRFAAPAEVKDVALLMINHTDRASDQWMWIPAEERDRRIALQDRSTRFFGTDFSFEDLEERDVDQYSYNLAGDDNLNGVACWKIESRPQQGKSSQYTSSFWWIRKDNYVITRLDNFDKDKLIRRINYTDIKLIGGIWTALTAEVAEIPRNSKTVLKLDKVDYNLAMKDTNFTREALRR